MDNIGGKALNGRGPVTGYRSQSNSECRYLMYGSQTTGAKVRGQEGKSPDRHLRSQNYAKWKRKCNGEDSQEVGLEEATPLKSA